MNITSYTILQRVTWGNVLNMFFDYVFVEIFQNLSSTYLIFLYFHTEIMLQNIYLIVIHVELELAKNML